ncbi:MAG: hypothetical protein ACREIW_14035, partial [Chthoniobacterales bacterium]
IASYVFASVVTMRSHGSKRVCHDFWKAEKKYLSCSGLYRANSGSTESGLWSETIGSGVFTDRAQKSQRISV